YCPFVLYSALLYLLSFPTRRSSDLHLAVERRGKFLRGLANEIGFADAREEFGERDDAPGLRLAAGDPENVAETGERARRGVRVGGFGIVDEQDAALAADLFHAMREAGKGPQALLDGVGVEP